MTKVVLILEDTVPLLEAMAITLQNEFPDVTFLKARSGNEAVELIKKYNPDVALVDHHVPEITGAEVIKVCKKDGWCGEAVMLTNSQLDNVPKGNYEFHVKSDTSINDLKNIIRNKLK